MKTICRAFLFIIFIISFCACKKFDSHEFVGKYKLDHPVLKRKINYDFEPILKINADNTFELQKDVFLKGTWRFSNFEHDKAIIYFTYKNKNISAMFDGNIIYFEYPNDFDNGAFNSMLYVRFNP